MNELAFAHLGKHAHVIRLIALRCSLIIFMLIGFSKPGCTQSADVPFTSGPIPMCDTSTFTATVWGAGTLMPPGTYGASTLYSLSIDITSDHPQTLQIFLTSPQGTTLSLSEFNGNGGQNYTGTTFLYEFWPPSITTGTAPFTGYWVPQGGSLSLFDWQNADGTWTITVIDTACANGGVGPGGNWTPGWFNGGAGTGGFSFVFNEPPPPMCWGGIPSDVAYVCNGQPVDILGYYEGLGTGYSISVTPWSGQQMMDPNAVTEPGTYWIDAYDQWDGCWYFATYEVVNQGVVLGPDQTIDQCSNAGPVDLNSLFNFGAQTPQWTLNGVPINGAGVTAATAPGVYQVTTANFGSCADTATVTLNVFSVPDLGADQNVDICTGASVDLTTLYNTMGLSASWDFGGAEFLTPAAAADGGVYSLIGTTPEGCTDTAEVTLVVGAAPALGPDQNVSFCSNTSFDLTSLHNTTGYTTTWSYLGTPVSDPSGINIGGPYQLIASNGGSCADTAMVYVATDPAPILGPDIMATTCEGIGEDISSYFTASGLTTEWNFVGAPVTDPTSVMIAGSYTLIATNGAGCTDTAQVDLEVMPLPVLGPDQAITVCEGVPVDLTALFVTGANTASWSINGLPVADPGSVAEAGEYVLIATSAAGCSSSALVSIVLEPSPALGSDQSLSICEGSFADLSSLYDTNGSIASWTLSGAVIADPASVDNTGTYRLIATNAGGCTDTAFVQLNVGTNPALGPDRTFPLCPWQTVDLVSEFSIGGMTASYTFNDQPVNEPNAVVDPGTYVITVTDVNGCSDTAMATVIAIECMCVADFTEDARCMQEPVQFMLLADSAIVSAEWSFNGAADNSTHIDPIVRFGSEGEVLVSLRATLGCGVVEVERAIRIEDCSDSCAVWIPSSFTPNGDGINDSWTWRGECDPEDFSMLIYDRFGELIFATNDPQITWDGNFKGVASPLGVYAYRAGYRLPYQDRKEVAGSITLVR